MFRLLAIGSYSEPLNRSVSPERDFIAVVGLQDLHRAIFLALVPVRGDGNDGYPGLKHPFGALIQLGFIGNRILQPTPEPYPRAVLVTRQVQYRGTLHAHEYIDHIARAARVGQRTQYWLQVPAGREERRDGIDALVDISVGMKIRIHSGHDIPSSS